MALPRRLQIKLQQRLQAENDARMERFQRFAIISFLIIGSAELIWRNWPG
jgi:hypothetical protein